VLASILIIIFSFLLLLYWLRYTCLLLLQNGSAHYALKVASTVRLNFPQVQEALQTTAQAVALDHIHESLEHDYRILTDLLQHATGGGTIQRRILTIDYKIMQGWYRLTRTSRDHVQARRALAEMSSILSYFAEEIGSAA
jgi:predicted ATPase